jgi:hypothetical protein
MRCALLFRIAVINGQWVAVVGEQPFGVNSYPMLGLKQRVKKSGLATFSDMGLRRTLRLSVPVAGARHGANRLSGSAEHFAAYAGSGAIAMAGYGLNRGAVQVIGSFWVYAGILGVPATFLVRSASALEDFAASAIGALCGGVAVVFLWRYRSAPLGPRAAA